VSPLKEIAFSLVIPTFNSAGRLEHSLTSIRTQSFPKLEVIIVDGGSTDETLSIALSQDGLVVRIISEPDHGIYDAINKGVAVAHGDLICVLGSDDQLEAGALAKIHAAWLSQPSAIIAGRTLLEDEHGALSLRPDEGYGPGARLSGIPFCHNAMFATQEAYARVGQYDLGYRICADADWVHRAIQAGCTGRQIDAVIVRFKHGGLSTTQPKAILEESFRLVAANFPGLSLAEAEDLFRAVRGWSDVSRVEPILTRHRGNADLLLAAALAFSQRAQRLACAAGDSSMASELAASAPSRFTTGVLRRIRRSMSH
jgi:glycosyltransferase involved in cell wall biosynthesis